MTARYGGRWGGQIESSIRYWETASQNARASRVAGNNRNLNEVLNLGGFIRPNYYRVHLTFSFANPNSLERERRGYIVDTEAGISKQRMFSQIRDVLARELLRQYSEGGRRTEQTIRGLIDRINVTRIEVN